MNIHSTDYIGATGLFSIFEYVDDTCNLLATQINNTSNILQEQITNNKEFFDDTIGITDNNYITNWNKLTSAYGSNLISISSNIGFININDKNNRCIYRYGDIKEGIEGLTDSDKLATILGVNYLGIPNVNILVEQLLTIYGWGNDIIDDDFEFVMVNNTYPFPYKWLKEVSESPLLNNMNINIYDSRINSSNITKNVEELIKIVAEHEIRLSVSDFRTTLSPIDTAKIIAKWIYNTGKIATGLAPLTSQIFIKLLTHLDLIGGYTGYFRLEDYKDDLMDATINGVDTLFTAQYAANSGFGTSIGLIETQVSKINTLLGITAGATGLNSVFNLGTFTSDLVNFLNSSGADGFTSNMSNLIYTTSNNLREYTNITSNNLIEYTNSVITSTSNNLIGYTNTTSNNLIGYTNTTSNNLIGHTNTTSNNLIGNINNTSNWIKYLKTETDALWLKSGGSVYNLNSDIGLGTISPEHKLDVVGTTQSDDLTIKNKIGVGTAIPTYELDVIGTIQGDELIIKNNVGIGTPTPTYELDVIGTIQGNDLTIKNNIGIGTTIPTYKLDVIGTIQGNDLTIKNKIGIGTTIPTYELDVGGTTKTENLIVQKYSATTTQNAMYYLKDTLMSNRFWSMNSKGLLDIGYLNYGNYYNRAPNPITYFNQDLNKYVCKYKNLTDTGNILAYLDSGSGFDNFLIGVNVKLDVSTTTISPMRIFDVWKGGIGSYIRYYCTLQPINGNTKIYLKFYFPNLGSSFVKTLNIDPNLEHHWIFCISGNNHMYIYCDGALIWDSMNPEAVNVCREIWIATKDEATADTEMIYSDVLILINYYVGEEQAILFGKTIYDAIKTLNSQSTTYLYGKTYIETLDVGNLYNNKNKIFLYSGNSRPTNI